MLFQYPEGASRHQLEGLAFCAYHLADAFVFAEHAPFHHPAQSHTKGRCLIESAPSTVAACPKCGKKRMPEAASCPRCGLVFARWTEESSPPLVPLDSRGNDLWQEVQGQWSDLARHEEFLKHCLQTDTLAAAGRMYRDRLDENPRDSVAAQMQAQILSKATLALSINKSHPREAVTRSRWFWAVILAAMAIGVLGGLYWRRLR